MFQYSPLFPILVLGLAACTTAQSASFMTFGTGCSGSATGTCVGNNAGASALDGKIISINPQYALLINAKTPIVSGFEIFTKSPVRRTFKAYIYLPDKAGPAPTGFERCILVDQLEVAWIGRSASR